jgi:HD-GYP domain-containing protein (c-di-GMP phosphodiesterase class II)
VQHRVENTLIMYSNQKRLVRLVESQVYERENINNAMVNIFSDVIETRNQESGNHTLNVQVITGLLLNRLVEISDRYMLSKSDVSLITTLSALHDIGKIKIPEAVLNKPGKLDAEEWALMQSHTTEGDAILSNPSLDQDSAFVKTARSICRSHHEKYDGHGYPDGLSGDAIPIAAQVVSIADVYDALTSERCYKPAFTHDKAIEMITGGECGAFNPLLLTCLMDISENLKELAHGHHVNHYDFQTDAISVANELLENDNLPHENNLHQLLDYEQRKKSFFMNHADGISFEFDKLQNKITFVNTTDPYLPKHKTEFTSKNNENNVLPAKYWDVIRRKLRLASHDDAIISADVELNIDGKLIPYEAKAMAIWPEQGTDYVSVIGHLSAK